MADADLDIAFAELATIRASASRLEGALERLRAADLTRQVADLPPCDVPVTEHRRLHRPGIQPRIDADPVLAAFILARIDRLTYKQIAEEVAAHFPPDRRVRHSAIHAWATRRRRGGRPYAIT